MPPHLRDMINQLSETDYVAREQCLDYLYDVAFRRSLLCHAHLQDKINRTEIIDKALLNKLTFIDQNKENNLSHIFNNQDVAKLLEHFIYQVGHFTIQSLTDYVAEHTEFENLTENEIYSSVLFAVVLGYIKVFLTPYQTYTFEDNKTYVPKRFTQYVQTLLEGADQYIGAGNMYNDGVENLNELHLYMMAQMEKPTTKVDLNASLKAYLIKNGYKDMNNEKLIDEEFDCSGLCDSICKTLANLGYIQPATL